MRFFIIPLCLLLIIPACAQTTSSKSKAADKLYERGLVIEQTKTQITPLSVIPVVPGVKASEVENDRVWRIGELIVFDNFEAKMTDSTVQFRGMSQLMVLKNLVEQNQHMRFAVFTLPQIEEEDQEVADTSILAEFAERYLSRNLESMEQLVIGEASGDWAEFFDSNTKGKDETLLEGKLLAMILEVK